MSERYIIPLSHGHFRSRSSLIRIEILDRDWLPLAVRSQEPIVTAKSISIESAPCDTRIHHHDHQLVCTEGFIPWPSTKQTTLRNAASLCTNMSIKSCLPERQTLHNGTSSTDGSSTDSQQPVIGPVGLVRQTPQLPVLAIQLIQPELIKVRFFLPVSRIIKCNWLTQFRQCKKQTCKPIKQPCSDSPCEPSTSEISSHCGCRSCQWLSTKC